MKKWIKQLRMAAVYFAVLLTVGYAVYADPDTTEETADTQEAVSSETPGTTDESGETRSSESEQTEEVTDDTSTETEEVSSSEETGDSTEEGSTELTTETYITIVASYYSVEDIIKMRDEYTERQNEVESAQKDLQSMQRRQSSFVAKLQEMDEKIIELEDKIEQLEEDQKQAYDAIDRLSGLLEESREKEEEQYERLKEHIQNAYENGNYSYVDALLNAKDFVELLNKPEYVQEVSRYDEKLLNDFKKTSQKIADQKLMIEIMTDGAGTMQNVYEDQQKALVLMTEAKQEEIIKNGSSIENQQEELDRLKRLEEEQAARLYEMENPTYTTITYTITPYSGGTFVWPQPSSYYITSDYGWRGDIGIPGASYDHKGIDISANMYDPVVAAAAGTVTYVGYYGTGGKTVMIDVGSAITIIYHHLNDYNVELGQHVEAGEVVGFVGMTGVTGGPHLHFSVRVNGVYVNPRPYLGLPMPVKETITTETTSTETTTTEENGQTSGDGQ